jgi:hypothetical protein
MKTVQYSFVISVLLTNNGVNNQRFRALFLLGSDLTKRLGKSRGIK